VASLDKYKVSLSHPDALIALLSGGGEINAHFTSPPFHQRERKSPNIRTIMTSNDVMGGPSTFTHGVGAEKQVGDARDDEQRPHRKD
jgi:NitT/TauT family transport system substrate-binding protein